MVKDLDKPIFIFLLPLLLVKNDFGLPTLLQSLNCTDMMLGENKYCKKKAIQRYQFLRLRLRYVHHFDNEQLSI